MSSGALFPDTATRQPIKEFSSNQWWYKKLEVVWNSNPGDPITPDMKRAAYVAMNLMKAVELERLKEHKTLRDFDLKDNN